MIIPLCCPAGSDSDDETEFGDSGEEEEDYDRWVREGGKEGGEEGGWEGDSDNKTESGKV